MGNAQAEDEVALFERDMKEFWIQFKISYGTEQNNQTSALRDLCKETIEALSGKKAKGSMFVLTLLFASYHQTSSDN